MLVFAAFNGGTALSQSVCLPAPRLLTTMPMGGQIGTEVEITITGQYLEDAGQLRFSTPGMTASQKLGADGQPLSGQYIVKIADDCPRGVHEATVMTRLGISTSRVFSVGDLPEVTRTKANTSLETAMPINVNSVCNATATNKSIDHYRFEAKEGQRIMVDCAARRIDSKLYPVVIIGDSDGRDLVVERRGGALDFTIPADGSYTIKVHELTFKGGTEYFYRLALRQLEQDATIERMAAISAVNACSWPPVGLPQQAALRESEPNNDFTQAQKIVLPCDLAGSFFPAADVDTFEFTAMKGETWWVEVGSERLGLPTDPSVLVQHVSGQGDSEELTDVAELSDIASPVKVSSNGYSYDGPPYNAGSSDVLGKITIKADGVHRLRIRDLFGGTRSDPRNVYRLIIRKAAPDFALVGWALHMGLRNGDRNALSKPIALRRGSTMPIEVVVVRRDGFGDEIELVMENLPDGVRATGLKIPKGQSRGIMLITSDEGAPAGISTANFFGRAEIGGQSVTRPCRMASMSWPVTNAKSEIPAPRLLADIPVSVSGSELAPITIAPREQRIWEATAGEKLAIPLVHMRRCEFSGASLSLKTFGAGFEATPPFDIPLTADSSEAVLDLAKLKTPPGDYLIAFYGGAVAKYRHNPDAVVAAEAAHKKAQQEAVTLSAKASKLADAAASATGETKADADQAAAAAVAKQKSAAAAVDAAAKHLATVTKQAQPKDIVDVFVSEPIAIRVKPAETK